jgi:hypothetical protein
MKHRFLTLIISLSLSTIYAQNMGVKLPDGATPNTTLDVNGAASLREGTALSLANGVNNDISLASNEYSIYRITGPSSAFSITGFTNGVNGRIITVVNATTQTMTISGATSSSAANQLLTAGLTFTVPANGSATFMYNTTLTKWVLTGTSGSSNSSSGWGLTGNTGTTAGTNFVGTTDAQDLAFRANNTERMRIATTGNVGLGLTSPSVKLHQDNGTGTANYHKFTANTTTGTASTDGFDVGIDASGNAVLNQKEALNMLMSTNNTEVMRITSAGNVLIGGGLTPGETTAVALVNQSSSDQKDDITITTYNTTTTPAFVLFKARGTAASPSTLTNSEDLGGFNVNGYAGSSFRGLTSLATITASDYTTSYGADIAFKTSRSGTTSERMRIMSTGNVGIGVTAPSHILQINGQGRSTNSAWATTSDSRLKDIDGQFEYGLKELLKINTVCFHYKKDNPLQLPTDKAFQGVIAQELQKVIPEAVTQQADGYLTVSTDPIFWTMVNAIKDLKKENEDLEREIQTLKAELTQKDKTTEGVLLRLEKLETALFSKINSEKQKVIEKEQATSDRK